MNPIATRNDEMLQAFAPDEEIQSPPPRVHLTPAGQQLEQRPIGAQKLAVKRDPEGKILQSLRTLAAAAGEDWFYRFPVKKKIKDDEGRARWTQDFIEGPSIKCALTVARRFGNCDVDVRTQDAGEHWLFYARFLDYENGFSMTRAYQQRKGQQAMNTDNARALDIVFQIGQSKAIRNVICNALTFYTDFAFEEARQAIVVKVGKNLESYRAKAIARLSELKIESKRVEAVIGRPVDKWLAPDVARVIAEIQAVNDGMALADDLYPPLNVPVQQPERADFSESKDESPLGRAARLLGQCRTKDEVAELKASIFEEIADERERATLDGICDVRLKELAR